MGDAKKPGWGAFLPRFNIPETFGTALSYEGQLHWFLENWDQVADYANALEQPTIDVGATTFPDTSNALTPSITNVGTDINAVLDFIYPIIRTRFADPLDWDFNTAYDVLTVVSDGQGNSYTSRQAVPAHTPLADTDYWLLTGSYDASLQSIRDDLSTVKTGYCRTYDSDADLVEDSANLIPGMICHTIGSAAPGDGGGRWYKILASYSGASDYLQLAGDYAAVIEQPAFLRIDPDIFTGSDSDKLEHAMDAVGNEAHATIIITRKYTLERDLPITHRGAGSAVSAGDDVNARLSFLGIGEGCGIDCGQYSIVAYNTRTDYGMLTFDNILFTGTSVIFNCDYLIRCVFINCVFSGGTDVFVVPRFMQSYVFMSCTFRKWTGYVIKRASDVNNTTLDDVQFVGCLIEHGGGVVDIYSLHGVTFSQCCIEGNSLTLFTFDGDSRSFNVINSYFESNNNDNDNCVLDFKNATDSIIQEINIEHNRFSQPLGAVLVKLPNSTIRNGSVVIRDNWTSPNGVIAAIPHPDRDYYPTVYVSGSPSATLDETRVKRVDYGNIANIRTLDSAADLDTIGTGGLYYGPAGHSIANCPTTKLFYMLHFRRSSTIFFQVVFSRDGMWFRLSGYPWQAVSVAEVQ